MTKMKRETILLLQLLLLNWALAVNAECPFKLDYVRQLPWDKSTCESATNEANEANCCHTLRSLLGVGLARYLKDASVFEFPSNASAVSCFGAFQEQLDSLTLPPDLVANCFKNTTEFISSPLLCVGIQTKQDWIRRVKNTSLDSTCKGDLSNLGACLECHESGKLVTKMLADMDKNMTSEQSLKCLFFTCLYAAGVVNEFGPIADWAWALVRKGRTSEIVDKRIRQRDTENVMERFVLVSILCSHVMVAFRPRMVDAVKMLQGLAEIPEIPDRPLPIMLHGLSVTDKDGSLDVV